MKNSCNKQLSYIPHWNVVRVVSFIVFNSVCFPEHRLINYFIVFILVQMYRYSIVLCQVIIKKHRKKSIDPNSEVSIINMWGLLQHVRSNRTIISWYIYPELLTIQI